MFGFGKKRLVCIDIGTLSIKIVELSRAAGHFKLETYGLAQINSQASLSSNKSPLDITIQTLAELLKRARAGTKKIVASLPTSTVFVTVIEIPKLPSAQLKKAVEAEAKKIIPLPIEDMTVSWNN